MHPSEAARIGDAPPEPRHVLRLDEAARRAAARAIAQGGEADPKDFVRPRPACK